MEQGMRIGRSRKRHENAKQKRKRRAQGLTTSQIKKGVLEGLIPSAISDTGATSTAGAPKDTKSFDVTGEPSTKVFELPDGREKAALSAAKLRQRTR